ncbi:MAG: redoxin domain-containing protein [Ideonella sp.]|nr:redoxin domain-containing protein [Ideonella sp.]MCC7458706.1 redoxin domain-containing protein [Nitrospira sp.]
MSSTSASDARPGLGSVAPLRVARWFNTPQPLALDALRGRVVAVHAFQMLCPACVSHGLPQAARLHEMFARDDLVVIGLHTVFEHHAVMGADALQAFIHEYRLRFPIAIDEPDAQGSLPRTMAAWDLQGTPSLLLFDRQGRLQLKHFGHLDDLALGVVLGQLLTQRDAQRSLPGEVAGTAAGCSDDGCAADTRTG